MATTKRDTYIDIVSGIMIIYMLIYHLLQWTEGITIHILFFFMPWFFFKSGMYFRKADYKSYLKKNVKHLLIPFFWFSLIGTLFYWADLIALKDFNWLHYILFLKVVLNGSVPGNTALWFLISLFLVKMIYNLTYTKVQSFVIMLSALGIAYLCSFLNIDSPKYLANASSGLVFFTIGHMLKEKQFMKHIIIACLLIYILIAIFCPSIVDMYGNKTSSGVYILWYPFSLAGIIIMNNLVKITPLNLYKTLIFRIIQNIGKNSMNYYVTHWVLLLACKIIMVDYLGYKQGDNLYVFATCLSLIVLLPISSYIFNTNTKLRFLVGK